MYLEFLDLKQWVCHKFAPDEAVVDEEILAKSEPSANLSKILTHMLQQAFVFWATPSNN